MPLLALDGNVVNAPGVPTASEVVQQLMHSTDQSVWAVTALCLVLDGRASTGLQGAAADVLASFGLDGAGSLSDLDGPGVAAQAAAPVLQAAALLRGDGDLWATQSDAALLAQGRASAQGTAMFAQFGVPRLAGLASAISQPGAQMLDVGTGVAALAVAYAKQFPELTVVGIDVLPRVLVLAAATVASSTVPDRVVLRNQDIATLDDRDTYALAWVPAPFVPEAALDVGMARVVQALTPGGWVMLGHGRFTGDPVNDALTRFKTVVFGGTPLDDEQAQRLVTDAGLESVSTLATPPGAPAITVGQRPQ
jgi:hypothetical protein